MFRRVRAPSTARAQMNFIKLKPAYQNSAAPIDSILILKFISLMIINNGCIIRRSSLSECIRISFIANSCRRHRRYGIYTSCPAWHLSDKRLQTPFSHCMGSSCQEENSPIRILFPPPEHVSETSSAAARMSAEMPICTKGKSPADTKRNP